MKGSDAANKNQKLKTDKEEANEIEKIDEDELTHYIKEIDEIEDMPEEIKKQIEVMMTSRQIGMTVSNANPMEKMISKKIESKHIDKFLEIAAMNEKNSFEDRQNTKKDVRLFVIIGVAVFIFLVIFLSRDNSDLLIDILTAAFAFLGGFGAGNFYSNKKN